MIYLTKKTWKLLKDAREIAGEYKDKAWAYTLFLNIYITFRNADIAVIITFSILNKILMASILAIFVARRSWELDRLN